MTAEEAIKVLERQKDICKSMVDFLDEDTRKGLVNVDNLLSTTKMAIETLEKQIPKKTEIWKGQALCPYCGYSFGDMKVINNLVAWNMPHCKNCGQAIDWSEE